MQPSSLVLGLSIILSAFVIHPGTVLSDASSVTHLRGIGPSKLGKNPSDPDEPPPPTPPPDAVVVLETTAGSPSGSQIADMTAQINISVTQLVPVSVKPVTIQTSSQTSVQSRVTITSTRTIFKPIAPIIPKQKTDEIQVVTSVPGDNVPMTIRPTKVQRLPADCPGKFVTLYNTQVMSETSVWHSRNTRFSERTKMSTTVFHAGSYETLLDWSAHADWKGTVRGVSTVTSGPKFLVLHTTYSDQYLEPSMLKRQQKFETRSWQC